MSLTKSRKLISLLLIIITVIGGIMAIGSQTAYLTLCNENYITNIFTSDSVTEECSKNFNDRAQALSEQSSIPAEVFTAVYRDNPPTTETAVKNFFRYSDASLYSNDLTDKFEKLCMEYLDGNEIKYDEQTIRHTAEYAAKVYSDCYGMKDTEEAVTFINSVRNENGKYVSAGLMLVILSVLLVMTLYRKKTDSAAVLHSAFISLGASTALIGIAGIIISAVKKPMITPDFYASAVSRALMGAFATAAAIGIVIAGAALYFAIKQYKNKIKQIM